MSGIDPLSRPAFRRWPAIVFLGPLAGTTAVFGVALLLDGLPGGLDDTFQVFALVLFFGELIGLLPAALAALMWERVPSGLPFHHRLIASLVIGAFCGLTGSLLAILLLFDGLSGIRFETFAIFAFAGATGLSLTALPGTRR